MGVIELIFGDAFADIDGDVTGLGGIEELGDQRDILKEEKKTEANPEVGLKEDKNPFGVFEEEESGPDDNKNQFELPVMYS